ncbi:MAG: hypothetical protein C4295_11800 [Candidatus Fervidibacterota bacterium]
MERQTKGVLLFFFLAFFVLPWVYGAVVLWLNRPMKAQPLNLRIRIIPWTPKEIALKEIAFVDLDGDGEDEIIGQDNKSRWWWGTLKGDTFRYAPLPVPERSCLRFGHRQQKGQVVVCIEPFPLLLTRTKSGWVTKRITVKATPRIPPSAERVRVGDLDGDGYFNDVLVLTDERTVEWWQRTREGKFIRQDRLRLPLPSEGISSVGSFSFKSKWRHISLGLSTAPPNALPGAPASPSIPAPPMPTPPLGPMSLPTSRYIHLCIDEKGRLKWRGTQAASFAWTKEDLDGDGRVDWVERWGWETTNPNRYKLQLFVRFANGQGQALPVVDKGPIGFSDLDGNGRKEIVVVIYSNGSAYLLCFRWCPSERKWEAIKSPSLPLSGEDYFEDYFTDERLLVTNDSVWAITERQGRRQIERWRIKGDQWCCDFLLLLPKSEGEFSVIWTGADWLLVERRPVALPQRMAASFYWHLNLTAPATPSRLWAWKSEGKWQFVQYLPAFFDTSWDTLGTSNWMVSDLDNDGIAEIVWTGRNFFAVGQYREGTWRMAQEEREGIVWVWESAFDFFAEGCRWVIGCEYRISRNRRINERWFAVTLEPLQFHGSTKRR